MSRISVQHLVGVFLWMVSVQTVNAVGLCENLKRLYALDVRFSEVEQKVAFRGSQDWCEEIEKENDIDEVRGTFYFVEIRDRQNNVVERLASVRGKRSTQFNKLIGEFRYVSAKRIEMTLKERGFRPINRSMKSPKEVCTFRLRLYRETEKQQGFPARKVRVEVKLGKKVVATKELGVAARWREDELALRTFYLTDKQELLLWVRIPHCEGPPPGYFGETDGGDCYPIDEVVIDQLTLDAHPELVGCFK